MRAARKTLTRSDKKELKYQCRMGYIIPVLIFIIGTGVIFAIYLSSLDNLLENFDIEIFTLLLVILAVLSVVISFSMNKKYFADIRNNEKLIETKTIQKKLYDSDSEAGSGTFHAAQNMKKFDKYEIVVENVRHRVDKDLFDHCNEGDKVLFSYGPVSSYLINIELADKRRS